MPVSEYLVGDIRYKTNKIMIAPHANDFLEELDVLMQKFDIVKIDVAYDLHNFKKRTHCNEQK